MDRLKLSAMIGNEMKPKSRVPISAQRIRDARELILRGDNQGAAAILREVREKLEDYERRLNHNRP